MQNNSMTQVNMPAHTHNHHNSSVEIRQSFNLALYNANIVLSLDNRSNINILKNRFKEFNREDDIPLEKAIDILTEMITIHIFKGRVKLFQEGMKIELIKSINKTIKEGVIRCETLLENDP